MAGRIQATNTKYSDLIYEFSSLRHCVRKTVYVLSPKFRLLSSIVMAPRLFCVLGLLLFSPSLLAAQSIILPSKFTVLFNVSSVLTLVATTLSSNLSRTATLTSTPVVTGDPCCVVIPDGVGLDFWYTSSLEKVVATVLTQYLQYNNTVLTSTSTILNPNATYKYPNTPLIPGNWLYTVTSQANYTVTSFPYTSL